MYQRFSNLSAPRFLVPVRSIVGDNFPSIIHTTSTPNNTVENNLFKCTLDIHHVCFFHSVESVVLLARSFFRGRTTRLKIHWKLIIPRQTGVVTTRRKTTCWLRGKVFFPDLLTTSRTTAEIYWWNSTLFNSPFNFNSSKALITPQAKPIIVSSSRIRHQVKTEISWCFTPIKRLLRDVICDTWESYKCANWTTPPSKSISAAVSRERSASAISFNRFVRRAKSGESYRSLRYWHSALSRSIFGEALCSQLIRAILWQKHLWVNLFSCWRKAISVAGAHYARVNPNCVAAQFTVSVLIVSSFGA